MFLSKTFLCRGPTNKYIIGKQKKAGIGVGVGSADPFYNSVQNAKKNHRNYIYLCINKCVQYRCLTSGSVQIRKLNLLKTIFKKKVFKCLNIAHFSDSGTSCG